VEQEHVLFLFEKLAAARAALAAIGAVPWPGAGTGPGAEPVSVAVI
jgi:hypothetical protein